MNLARIQQILSSKDSKGPDPKKVVTTDQMFSTHFGDLGNTYKQTLMPISGGGSDQVTFQTNPRYREMFPAIEVKSDKRSKKLIISHMTPDGAGKTGNWKGRTESIEMTPEEFASYYNELGVKSKQGLSEEQSVRDDNNKILMNALMKGNGKGK